MKVVFVVVLVLMLSVCVIWCLVLVVLDEVK